MDNNGTDDYLFFSAAELIGFFRNDLRGKDVKTQVRRVMEMAKIFLARKNYRLEDVYSMRVLLRDGNESAAAAAAISLYFAPERCPVGAVLAGGVSPEVFADLEVDFSACRLPKTYIRAAGPLVRAPFAAAVRLDGYAHCAGVRPAAGESAYDQAVSCLAGLGLILRQAGTGPEHVYALTAGVSERDLPALEKALAGWGGKEDMVREADFSARPCGPWLMELACSAAAPVPPERG